MLTFKFLDPRVTDEHLGFIPEFLSEHDERSAVEQIDANYSHGGGWNDTRIGEGGFRILDQDMRLKFPGDPPLMPYAVAELHERGDKQHEKIVIYEHAYVGVFIMEGKRIVSFRVARID